MVSKKSVWTVFFEAFIVGVILVIIYNFIKYFGYKYIPNFSGNKVNIEIILVSGIVFHLLFEYTGLNIWYSKKYCEIIG
jgi:hypothetical protein